MKSDLTRAAEALEYEANRMRDACTLYGALPWAGDERAREDKRRHDDYLALASRLRKLQA